MIVETDSVSIEKEMVDIVIGRSLHSNNEET